MSDKGTVFTVKFACDNCGKEWSEEYNEKVRVWRMESHNPPSAMSWRASGTPTRIYVSDARVKPMIEKVMVCPNCNTFQDVKIIQRIPIEERSTID